MQSLGSSNNGCAVILDNITDFCLAFGLIVLLCAFFLSSLAGWCLISSALLLFSCLLQEAKKKVEKKKGKAVYC